MWTHIDEDWFNKRECLLKEAGLKGQPKTQSKWKHEGRTRHKFDVAFEEYCFDFLESIL